VDAISRGDQKQVIAGKEIALSQEEWLKRTGKVKSALSKPSIDLSYCGVRDVGKSKGIMGSFGLLHGWGGLLGPRKEGRDAKSRGCELNGS